MPNRLFKLGTTSFIYPDHIIPNVRKLGVFFDEIELLVFESIPSGVLPSKSDIRELECLSKNLDLSYNIHLPTDISLTDSSARQRAVAVDTLLRVIQLLAPLNPTTYTLHLPMDKGFSTPGEFDAWDKRARKGLELLVSRLVDPGILSLETLWYYPGCLQNLVKDFNLSLCIDMGHHFKYDHDLRTSFGGHGYNIPVVHLHGVDFSGPTPKDHVGLDSLSDDMFQLTTKFLSTYEGTVSLEVFNLKNLNRSLVKLSSIFSNIPTML
ncbi:MAG: sugar phosphate isomerase/epimerase [Desulfobacteraceae bacterium]|nr:sugar phosphate isomerase/epimerase [Desulfobacteraceae bacterium]